MDALILAAGFGTRLLPYTKFLPKPLFTLNSLPIIHHTIESLQNAGCTRIIINTHHLADQISQYIKSQNFDAKIILLYEPEILDTGGAIANAAPFIKTDIFYVVNADIISSVDLNRVASYHKQHDRLATLIVHDFPQFNKIKINTETCIENFDHDKTGYAFTGLHIISKKIFKFFPDTPIFSIIDVYKKLCPENQIAAYVYDNFYWSDIGTPGSYQTTSIRLLCCKIFALPMKRAYDITISPIAGDGSDRKWFRGTFKQQSCVVSSHGICLNKTGKSKELRSFTHIGSHLKKQGIAVPEICTFDELSGIVILEDLGSTHLQDQIIETDTEEQIINWYIKVIDQLLLFSKNGIKNFNADWTCQTRTYSKELIRENECNYFLNSFISGYLKKQIDPELYQTEFQWLSVKTLEHPLMGLMHRDCQSRNIMIHDNNPCFIDFQSARTGPLQYDLASLLIDPYVNLDESIQTRLVRYTVNQLNLDDSEKNDFIRCFNFCCITRNLQMLGAFGYLIKEKNKPWFEQFIPLALAGLKTRITEDINKNMSHFVSLIQSL